MAIQILLFVLIVIGIIRISLIKVGALWLRLALIDLLAVLLVWCLSAIGDLLGYEIITRDMLDLAATLAVLTISFAFEAAHQRRRYLMRAEAQRRADLNRSAAQRIAELESIRGTRW